MRILIIRHGEPDYEKDSLTPRGWQEAEILSKYLKDMKIDSFYVSPLGRAQDTIKATMDILNREPIVLPWLKEFSHVKVARPDSEEKTIAWDWLPKDWTTDESYYLENQWYQTDIMKDTNIYEEYQKVVEGLDTLLAEHGYVRDGRTYKAVRPNKECIALVCHFGLESLIIGHLLGISPMILWHGFIAMPTSITSIYTEERTKGIASFRINCFGGIPHLDIANEEPSFSGRFMEVYEE